MINSFCDVLRREYNTQLDTLRNVLEVGTTGRDDDQRIRGEIRGTRRALEILDELEIRARKAAANGDDML